MGLRASSGEAPTDRSNFGKDEKAPTLAETAGPGRAQPIRFFKEMTSSKERKTLRKSSFIGKETTPYVVFRGERDHKIRAH